MHACMDAYASMGGMSTHTHSYTYAHIGRCTDIHIRMFTYIPVYMCGCSLKRHTYDIAMMIPERGREGQQERRRASSSTLVP